MPGDQFAVMLGVDKKNLSIDPGKTQALFGKLRQINLDGYQLEADDEKSYLKMLLPNKAFSAETAEVIASKLAELISKTKNLIDESIQ